MSTTKSIFGEWSIGTSVVLKGLQSDDCNGVQCIIISLYVGAANDRFGVRGCFENKIN